MAMSICKPWAPGTKLNGVPGCSGMPPRSCKCKIWDPSLQRRKTALTRILIGTKGLFVKSQVWFSEPGLWRLYLIVCNYPEPVRMAKCQNFCNRQPQVSVDGSSGVSPSFGEGQQRTKV